MTLPEGENGEVTSKPIRKHVPHLNDMLLQLAPFLMFNRCQIFWRLNAETVNQDVKQFIERCERLVGHEERLGERRVYSFLVRNLSRMG